MNKLADEEVTNRLAELEGWVARDQHIEKDFEFADFRAAMAFINHLVPIAESLNHHPDWSNSYNKVHISLTSHDAGGLTYKDFSFASATDEVAKQDS